MADVTRANRTRTSDKPGPTIFVLFGATGDLAKRMVIPAFYRLAIEGLLPKDWILVGNGRGDVAHEDFRKHVHDVLTEFGPKPSDGPWDSFSERLWFAGGGFNTDDPGSLLDVLAKARVRIKNAQLVHYFAVPPVAFTELTKALGEHGLAEGARVVYEKPFGTSPEKFRALDRVVHSVLKEDQVYRIDHFLGKEATQDLHVLRFANEMFAAMWNREHIESVQIDVPERLGITDRAVFYDATGAVLDMLVTHLFQVAAEVAMEPPASLEAADLQAAREKVIKSFRPLDPAEVVLGQFEGYRDVPGRCGPFEHGHLRRRPAVDRQSALARGAVLSADGQAAGDERAAGEHGAADAVGADRRLADAGQCAELLAVGQRRDRVVAAGQTSGPATACRPGHRDDPAQRSDQSRPVAALRAADPRRAAR